LNDFGPKTWLFHEDYFKKNSSLKQEYLVISKRRSIRRSKPNEISKLLWKYLHYWSKN